MHDLLPRPSRKPGERSNGRDESWKSLKCGEEYPAAQLEYVSVAEDNSANFAQIWMHSGHLHNCLEKSKTVTPHPCSAGGCQQWLQKTSRTSKVSHNGPGSALGTKTGCNHSQGYGRRSTHDGGVRLGRWKDVVVHKFVVASRFSGESMSIHLHLRFQGSATQNPSPMG